MKDGTRDSTRWDVSDDDERLLVQRPRFRAMGGRDGIRAIPEVGGGRAWIGVGKLTLKAGLNPWGLLDGPPLAIDAPARRAFGDLLERATKNPIGLIEYELAWPKYAFLSYAVHARGFLLHGTTSPHLELLTPSPALDHGAREKSVVSATNDGIWPLFYAALNRDEAGSLWNGSLHVRRGRHHHGARGSPSKTQSALLSICILGSYTWTTAN